MCHQFWVSSKNAYFGENFQVRQQTNLFELMKFGYGEICDVQTAALANGKIPNFCITIFFVLKRWKLTNFFAIMSAWLMFISHVSLFYYQFHVKEKQ